MAVNDTVRGLKGTITKLKEEIARIEVARDDAVAARHVFQSAHEEAEQAKADLERRIAFLKRDVQRTEDAASAHKARADQLERELEHSRSLELDAVTKLRASEAERNRLNGYIQRVAEDDAAREGNMDVADSRSVPRRPPPPLSHGPDYTYPTDMYGGAMTDAVSSGRRRY
ncbi:chromosome segregation ATPase [Xanthobacter flavus]|uniref:Chromosome segregation ATPase n=1 Tax=Xanthobacter flavus TaxID=281 RepID=A0A9W6CTU5_XANFL|nr:hypothetical protein [Xanthobacter flavus]MDR6331941.1 chromosome segregation ATPase [Xanthobacter flavus]GLI25625.1 hypothetical protein XFLAVUS301_52990 [Xanthobacter flavus]